MLQFLLGLVGLGEPAFLGTSNRILLEPACIMPKGEASLKGFTQQTGSPVASARRLERPAEDPGELQAGVVRGHEGTAY